MRRPIAALMPETPTHVSVEKLRGGVLLIVLVLSAITALLLGSYLNLNLGTARLTQRTFDRGAAFHLAEAGLEEGLWTYNRLQSGEPFPWQGWTTDATSAWRTLDGFTLTGATTGRIRVYAHPMHPSANNSPFLVALAEVSSPGVGTTRQMIEVRLHRRSFFAAGLIALESLAFKGRNASFDAWNSDPDDDTATPPVPYTPERALDTGTVGIVARSNNDLEMRQLRLHGYLRTRSGVTPTIGADGLIGPLGTPPGAIVFERIGGDFSADFPLIRAPEDGAFLANFDNTLGTPGQATFWRAEALILNGRNTLTILGDVTLTLSSTTTAVSITGSAEIIIPSDSSLTLYTAGDVLIAGHGLNNRPERASAFQLWSTRSPASTRLQTITIAGRGSLSAVLYGPEADVTVNGNGDIFGAIIARRLVFTGNAAFHYDHALSRLHRHAPYGPETWRTVDDPDRLAALLPLLER